MNEWKLLMYYIANVNVSCLPGIYLSVDKIQRIPKKPVDINRHPINLLNSLTKGTKTLIQTEEKMSSTDLACHMHKRRDDMTG